MAIKFTLREPHRVALVTTGSAVMAFTNACTEIIALKQVPVPDCVYNVVV